MYRSSVPLIFSVILSGCVGAASVGKEEVKIYGDNYSRIDTIGGNVAYAQELSDEYLKQAGVASDAQDTIALGIIGAAATGAGGLVFNSGFDLVKGAGLAAGTTTAIGNYLKPEEATLALLNSAEQLVCIAKAGNLVIGALSSVETATARAELSRARAALAAARKSEPVDESAIEIAKKAVDTQILNYNNQLNSDAEEEAVKIGVGILGNGIRQVRVNLRKYLARQRPDYSALINQVSSMNYDVKLSGEAAKNFLDRENTEKTLEKLRNDVILCSSISI